MVSVKKLGHCDKVWLRELVLAMAGGRLLGESDLALLRRLLREFCNGAQNLQEHERLLTAVLAETGIHSESEVRERIRRILQADPGAGASLSPDRWRVRVEEACRQLDLKAEVRDVVTLFLDSRRELGIRIAPQAPVSLIKGSEAIPTSEKLQQPGPSQKPPGQGSTAELPWHIWAILAAVVIVAAFVFVGLSLLKQDVDSLPSPPCAEECGARIQQHLDTLKKLQPMQSTARLQSLEEDCRSYLVLQPEERAVAKSKYPGWKSCDDPFILSFCEERLKEGALTCQQVKQCRDLNRDHDFPYGECL